MNTISSLLKFIGNKMLTEMQPQDLTFTVNTDTVANPTSISAVRYGKVVQVVLWGTQFKTGVTVGAEVVTGLPAAKRQGNAQLGLGGSNSYNIQGNIYGGGVNSGRIFVGLKSGYSANTAMYASLIYIAQ